MSSSREPGQDPNRADEDDVEIFNPEDAAEEIDQDSDTAMDYGSEDEGGGQEIVQNIDLQNDSAAHFDLHKDKESIFCIAQHPTNPNIVATGGAEGKGEDDVGIGYIFDSTPEAPLLPASYEAAPKERVERKGLEAIFTLEGHTNSISALEFTLPKGEVLLSGGLDGKLRAYTQKGQKWQFLSEAQEVEEINWILNCPNPKYPNTIALGANDGSVWVYTVDTSSEAPLQIVQSYFLHGDSCTAGAWTVDGKLLATVSEDGSLYVWDVFGEAGAAGLAQENGQTVLGLTSLDQRFAVDGGLFSVAVAPSGAFLVVGGAGGSIKVIGLPRLTSEPTAGKQGAGASSKTKGGKQAGGKGTSSTASAGQSGQILADLQPQSDIIESLAFAHPPLTLLAAGSVDGSIALFDTAHRFAVRRHIKEAHEGLSVVKVEFVKNDRTGSWLLTSCGMDGVVRRWDTRGGTGMPNSGLVAEWRGHLSNEQREEFDQLEDPEDLEESPTPGGVLGFVQGSGERIVTAGNDEIAFVFESPVA